MTLGFILGWAACAIFMGAVETFIWFRNRRRALHRRENASLTEMMCPWPLRHDEIAARPDWVVKLRSHHSASVTQGEQHGRS